MHAESVHSSDRDPTNRSDSTVKQRLARSKPAPEKFSHISACQF
jgi:hypothetical protein